MCSYGMVRSISEAWRHRGLPLPTSGRGDPRDFVASIISSLLGRGDGNLFTSIQNTEPSMT